MKKVISLGIIISILFCLFGCDNKPTVNYDDSEFKELIDKWFVEDLSNDYTSTHFSLVNPEKYGIKNVEIGFGDIETDVDLFQQRLQQLEKIDTSVLSEEFYITYLSLKDYYSLMVEIGRAHV